MKELRYSTKARKDLKKYRGDPHKIKKLYEVLNMLVNDIEIPETFRPHKLTGQYRDCMECHIEGDFLLIWFDENSQFIEILTNVSHPFRSA